MLAAHKLQNNKISVQLFLETVKNYKTPMLKLNPNQFSLRIFRKINNNQILINRLHKIRSKIFSKIKAILV